MSTSGIGDPYWYEWYVGLDKIIDMLCPDNGVEYVIFQKELYNTIDDIVIGYNDGHLEECYQVKHEISTSTKTNLTFNKLLTETKDKSGIKRSLIAAIALGWAEATTNQDKAIVPILYTNREFGPNVTKRTFLDIAYSALPLGEFLQCLKIKLENSSTLDEIKLDTDDLNIQLAEFKLAIGSDEEKVYRFLSSLRIDAGMPSLEQFELEMKNKLARIFSCTIGIADTLFCNLITQLRIWTTTRRETEKVVLEDAYLALSIHGDTEKGEHTLVPPRPFFESRKVFCRNLVDQLLSSSYPVVFISGEPGSGKTSIISYIQSEYSLFSARFHTFKPISPEQRFYNSDDGLCMQESLWGDLLIQLRREFIGEYSKYYIPVLNSLCSVQKMRSEVLRLAELLHKKRSQKIMLCIDGIDHAARSKNIVTFLSSLYLPSEIPEGVCLVVVGQPPEMYSQYPHWINSADTNVLRLSVPTLQKEDIIQLLEQERHWHSSQIDAIANAIFSKTNGNNLSVVFAVEEAKELKTPDEVVYVLNEKHISDDVNQYYAHIWQHVEDQLSKLNLGFRFPGVVIASCIVLQNGRIKTDILCGAIQNMELTIGEWNELMGQLYPLVQPTEKPNEYTILHNDFRVFLMGLFSSHRAKFEEIALQLYEYLKTQESSIDRSWNLIPLLYSAGRKDLITEIFDTKFVIEALAEGMPRELIRENAVDAYRTVCTQENWKLYHQVYLAVNTLRQHYMYNEYYSRKYECKDRSRINMLQIEELRRKDLSLKTIDAYRTALFFALELVHESDSIHYGRARSVFELWLNDYTPLSFVTALEKDQSTNSGVWKTNTIDEIFRAWGRLAAIFEKDNCKAVNRDEYSSEQINAAISYNEAYFDYLFENGLHERAISALSSGPVSNKYIEDKTQIILLSGLGKDYFKLIDLLAKNSLNINNRLCSIILLLLDNNDVENYLNDIKIEEPTYILEDISYQMVLWSIISGYREYMTDCSVVIGKMFCLLNKIPPKQEDVHYLKKLMRLSVVIGQTIKCAYESFINVSLGVLELFIEDFFTTEYSRPFDFRLSHKTLLYLVLNQVSIKKIISKTKMIELASTQLFHVSGLGMHYKSIILDYFLQCKQEKLIGKYFSELYGKHGCSLFGMENWQETHHHFYRFINAVLPDLAREVSAKMKWDVVGYTGHKEYALWEPLQYFETIAATDPTIWSSEGLKLYELSCVADIFSNRVSGDIQNAICKAASRCGIADYWKLHQINETFCYDLHVIYILILDLIDSACSQEDLLTIWCLSCGIQSWYNAGDRRGIGLVASLCADKEKKLGLTGFVDKAMRISPSYCDIAEIQNSQQYAHEDDEYTEKRRIEKLKLNDYINSLDSDQILAELLLPMDEYIRWEVLEYAWEVLERRGDLSLTAENEFLAIVLKYLTEYDWNTSSCSQILINIINSLGSAAAWKVACRLGEILDSNNEYLSYSRNMAFLIKYISKNQNKEIALEFLSAEIDSQFLWITGCGHIVADYDLEPPIVSCFTIPTTLSELVTNILLEQFDLSNIHRTEIAMHGIYLLSLCDKNMFGYLHRIWDSIKNNQREGIIKICERWSQESLQGFEEIIPNLLEEYEKCNEYNKLLQLYYILKNINRVQGKKHTSIGCKASPIIYSLSKIKSPCLERTGIDYSVMSFLHIADCFEKNSDCNDDVYLLIKDNCQMIFERKISQRHSRDGDTLLPTQEKRVFANQVIYGEVKKNRWKNIPLVYRAQTLLQVDDTGVITRPPYIGRSKVWDIEELLKSKNPTDKNMQENHLNNICNYGVADTDIIIGACLFYPVDQQEGVVYSLFSKIVHQKVLVPPKNVYPALTVGSLLSYESQLFEPGEEDIYETGVCLTRPIVGAITTIYGNCLIWPSEYVKEIIGIHPSTSDPFIWTDETNNRVLEFQRFSYPTREAMRENYYRQPLMVRWVCDKKKIENFMISQKCVIYYTNKIESFAKLYI